ncbi:hypothetical protein MCOR03_006256 [Pyricularia oryzae]|nr:hypothetical protein MCOR31_009169 [Pyricularia oryzae]KAI6473702.1 hypothetical protein MCOR18_008147 [Pyricularia oryzae]KAI6488631.1 hypothetical protein MCOR11_008337 [Pyricularia oryzae]KAI6556570.1 hypothetical protein MCOR03_006256 [Pyricularia oryzae]
MALDPVVSISQTGVLQGFTTGPWVYSYIVTALLLGIVAYRSRDKYPDLPWLNPKGPTQLTASKQRAEFFANPRQTLREGTKRFKEQPYKLHTEHGPVVILPHKYVNELKSNRDLDFMEPGKETTHAHLPGFDPLNTPPELPQIINKHLTKALLSLTQPISLETTQALKDVFTETKDWMEINPGHIMLIVSRMSSRIFMGEELCRDQEWIRASSDYVAHAFRQTAFLSSWPASLRRIVHWVHPDSLAVREKLQRCRKVLEPHLAKRQAVIQEAQACGKQSPFDDSIEWFNTEVQGKKPDPASAQIALSLVAIHTTSDLLMQTMTDIAKSPELFAPLRQEAIETLSNFGLKKTAFQKLVLMDSCFKESQRIRPVMNTYFLRKVLKDITLNDGFVIKKGTKVSTDSNLMMDENIYPDPHRYNPYRFTEMRQNGNENKAHLVSVSPTHFGFGHGIHACPGRFFAANEVKIALAHMLLKYDWKLAEGTAELEGVQNGINYNVNPNIKLLIRRRREELDLESLEF